MTAAADPNLHLYLLTKDGNMYTVGVEYSTGHEPTELLTDLRNVGCRFDAASLPLPDPELLADGIVQAELRGPDGSEPDGRWTPAEQAGFLAAVRDVGARHGELDLPVYQDDRP